MEQEIWKDIKDWEGLYQISNQGRVRQLDRYVNHCKGKRFVKGRILNPYVSKRGYYVVDLQYNQKKKKYTIHRLLMEHFVPNPENKPCVDHINGIRTDNRLCNLRWVTQKENCNNPLAIENYKRMQTKEKILRQNLTRITRKRKSAPRKVYKYTKTNQFVEEYFSISEAGKQNNIDGNGIWVALDKPNRSAAGYRWYSKRIEPTQ